MGQVQSIGTDWNTGASATTVTTKDSRALQKKFSAILGEMAADPPFANTGGSSTSEAVTITKQMPDGSVLVTVMQGDKVISQKRTRGVKTASIDKSASLSSVADQQGSAICGSISKTKIIPTVVGTGLDLMDLV